MRVLTETLEKKSRRIICFALDKKAGATAQSLNSTCVTRVNWNGIVVKQRMRGVVAVYGSWINPAGSRLTQR